MRFYLQSDDDILQHSDLRKIETQTLKAQVRAELRFRDSEGETRICLHLVAEEKKNRQMNVVKI